MSNTEFNAEKYQTMLEKDEERNHYGLILAE